MSESSAPYYTTIKPTDAELAIIEYARQKKVILTEADIKIIARLQQLRDVAIVDYDAMTVRRCGPPEHCNGHAPRQPQTVEEMIIAARNL